MTDSPFDALEAGPEDRPHFESFRDRCGPILAWVEERFGPADRDGLWRYIVAERSGVGVKANLEETCVEWVVGLDGVWQRAGWTSYAVWATKTPVAVLMAAELVKHRGGGGR